MNSTENSEERGNMTQIHVQIPNKLTLGDNHQRNWKIFKQRFNSYVELTDLKRQQQSKQRALFINLLDDDALDMYNSFTFEENDTLEDILRIFEENIIGKSNITYERFKFNTRKQEEGEDFDNFIMEIQQMIKKCEYCSECSKSILKDKIVLGVIDSELQRELLKTEDLTLKKAIEISRTFEKANKQNEEIKGGNINKINKRSNQDNHMNKNIRCKFCGNNHRFKKEFCPAYGKTCSKCGKMNHFSSCCFSDDYKNKINSGNEVNKIDENDIKVQHINENERINNVDIKSNRKEVNCILRINNNNVKFQIDTGASVNILPIKYAKYYEKTNITLNTWTEEKHKPIGECREIVTNPKNMKKYNVRFIVCNHDMRPILGLQTCEKMNIIKIQEENFENIKSLMQNNQNSRMFTNGLGKFQGIQQLQVKENTIPVITAPRNVPIAVRSKLKEELERLEKMEVITKVEEPTDWVNQIVIVNKNNGKIRLCIDCKELNKVLLRERYQLMTLNDVIHQLEGSTVFSKADMSSGYWHVELDEESSKLTTFQTCFGRYRWLRLPFGLSVSAEIFQKKLNESLLGLEGVICIADDIVIHGRTEKEHDERMRNFIERCKQKGILLNKEKMALKQSEISFMGHTISKEGLKPDRSKIEAIQKFPKPSNKSELRSFIGIVNYLSKFINNCSEILMPLHNLLKNNIDWNWSKSQEDAFDNIKKKISEISILSIYDPNKPLTLENDASDYGLGSVLKQQGKPLAYYSRLLNDTEKRYAQIEKEMLAIVYGLKKFHIYAYGRDIDIITDHKPLVSIVQKPLSKAPRRLQHMLLKIQEYNYKLHFKNGKEMHISDALSRSPLKNNENVHLISNKIESSIKDETYDEIRRETEKDEILSDLKEIILKGWPNNKNEVPMKILPYFPFRDELTIEDGIIMRGTRFIIPSSLRGSMKRKMHQGHIGINACLRRGRTYLFWPNMSAEIKQFVQSCDTCCSFSDKQPQEPLIAHKVPSRAWMKVGTDIFTLNGRNYLVTTDYFSQFIEVDFLHSLLSSEIIGKLKGNFARHGIPEILISDNGPQYSSIEFKRFCQQWSIEHRKISPGNSKANGLAESSVKIIKKMMMKCAANKEDPYLALLAIRNTPKENMDYSPAQRLMGRRTRTTMPTHKSLLGPELIDMEKTIQQLENKQNKISDKFAHRRDLPPLQPGDKVYIQNEDKNIKRWKPARVIRNQTNRSYIVQTERGKELRRDRHHLIKLRNDQAVHSDQISNKEPISEENNQTPSLQLSNRNSCSRYGRTLRKPVRYGQ